MAELSTDSQAAPADTTSATATPVDASQSQAAVPAAATTDASATPATDASTAVAKPNEGEAPKPGDKPAEEAKPVEYEFKLPEGVDLKGEALDELKTVAKEFGLTQEQAQKVADLGAKQAQSFVNQMAEQQKALTAQWANDTKTDKEIGGDALPENLSVAKKALDSFGTPEFKTLLVQSGLGNHPEVVRFMVKAGKAISEDGRLITGNAAQVDRANIPIEDRIYSKK